MKFPCKSCGECCRHVGGLPALDRGDGTCRHFDERTHMCLVYDERPLACRVDAYFETRMHSSMSPATYYGAQAFGCAELEAGNADMPAAVLHALWQAGVDTAAMPRNAQAAIAIAESCRSALRPEDFLPMTVSEHTSAHGNP